MDKTYLLANFGGPRALWEVEPFLVALLTDPLVTGSFLNASVHRSLFTWIARKRTALLQRQYATIGGCSPIYEDTEKLAQQLSEYLQARVITFHRYLPNTHVRTITALTKTQGKIIGLPLFPHFTYSVTGSIQKFFQTHITKPIHWIAHFGSHPAFISSLVSHILCFLKEQEIPRDDCYLVFSAHSLPKKYIKKGDPYESQCQASYRTLCRELQIDSTLSYQSKFGYGRWLTPSTKQVVNNLCSTKSHVVIVPFSFVSDHIETLYEIDRLYLPPLRLRYQAKRLPTLAASPQWPYALASIMAGGSAV